MAAYKKEVVYGEASVTGGVFVVALLVAHFFRVPLDEAKSTVKV